MAGGYRYADGVMNEIRNLAKQHCGGPVTCARDFLRVEMQASLGESRLSLGHTSATSARGDAFGAAPSSTSSTSAGPLGGLERSRV